VCAVQRSFLCLEHPFSVQNIKRNVSADPELPSCCSSVEQRDVRPLRVAEMRPGSYFLIEERERMPELSSLLPCRAQMNVVNVLFCCVCVGGGGGGGMSTTVNTGNSCIALRVWKCRESKFDGKKTRS
jgi:hypothetical protein